MRLLALAKYADGVVLLTSAARIGAITLVGSQYNSIPATNWRNPTFDFFSLHLSQALQTRLRALASEESIECLDGDDMLSATIDICGIGRGMTIVN